MIRRLLIPVFLLFQIMGHAQVAASAPEMADPLRSDGKIYVVVTVIALVFIALAVFMFYIDRKVKKLEEKMDQHGPAGQEKK